MANIKTSSEQWAKAREYFEAGLSLSQIVAKTGISKTQISNKSKSEAWSKGNEKEQLVQDAVRVAVAKGTLTEQALTVHDELVDERTKHILFFNDAALTNVRESLATPCENQNDYRARADTISKGRADVLGKAPDTQVNIQNNTINRIERVILVNG